MALPLLEYTTTGSQLWKADQNEYPYIYRVEDVYSRRDEIMIWAAYRQVFSEHETLKFNRQITLETRLANGSITVRDFMRGVGEVRAVLRDGCFG